MHLTPPVFEKARSYLNVQLSHLPAGPDPQHTRAAPFITLSRECGSGGSSLARILAAELNRRHPAPPDGDAIEWAVFDQEIVRHMLSAEDLSPGLARFLPEDRLPELASSVGEIVGLHPNLWDLVQRTTRFLHRVASHGRAILVGRGANFATAGIRGGIHVRLTAPPETRARHMAQVLQCDLREATAHIRRVDAARRSFVRSVFDRDVADPLAYDLVINTGAVALDQAAAIIATLVDSRDATRPG